jgi:two-component system sensor kinase FixL
MKFLMSEAPDPLPRTRKDTEAHLRSILATVPDAMVVIDEAARILSFSAAAEKMFGYAESEVLGENVKLLMPTPDRERHDRYLRNYLDTGERKIIGIGRLTNARHRDGNTFPIELLIGEARMGDRRIFTGFIRDLTERQKTELRLQDLQSELTHVRRVSEISTLATSLAHELNQPLTAIANYSEGARMLVETMPRGEIADKLTNMLEATAGQVLRAGEIVRRLREFMSHGRTAYRAENLPRLITEANALALVGTREHGIEVEINLDPKAEQVLADRIQIQQVLVNLIRNGIDAMIESSRRRLHIRTCRENEFARVSVEDTGTGLDETVAARLFEPFITSKQSGMGVGLSICRTIVEAHRGRIWFEGVPTGGTAFHFTLPVAS